MSVTIDILDRLSGVAILKGRLAETAKNVDRSLWLSITRSGRSVAKGAGWIETATGFAQVVR